MKRKIFALLLCVFLPIGTLSDVSAVVGNQIAADGTYTGSGTVDFWADLYSFQVSVTVNGGTISNITQVYAPTSAPTEPDSAEYYHPRALSLLKNKLLGKPASTDTLDDPAVDAVTGATYSYEALRAAARAALESAPESAGEIPAIKYTVSYDLGGAPGTPPEPALYAPGEAVAVPSAPVWPGHIFDGWSGAKVVSGSFTMPEAEVVLTARWINAVSLVPGVPKSVVLEPGAYRLTADYSGQGLTQRKAYRLLCAYYDSDGRMRRVTVEDVSFSGGFQAVVPLSGLQTGWRCRLFLMDAATLAPLCPGAELSFTARVPDGSYAGSAQCLTGYMNYMVDVAITVKDGVIASVTDRTLREPMSAMDRLCYGSAWACISGIIAGGGIDVDGFQGVDAVSGATVSSRGINSAIANALDGQRAWTEEDAAGETYAPEGISLYARVYPVVTVSGGKITEIRIVPAKDTDTKLLTEFADQILDRQSVEGLAWPDEIRDDAYATASLIDQILYGKGVLK